MRNISVIAAYAHIDARIAAEYDHTLVTVPGGDHFLNACCVPALLEAFEQAIAEAEGAIVAEGEGWDLAGHVVEG